MTATLPTSTRLKPHLLEALQELGGTADNARIADFIARRLSLSDALLQLPHDPSKGQRTEFAYRLAWARTRLKSEGLIERAGSRLWRLTDVGASRLGTGEVKPA